MAMAVLNRETDYALRALISLTGADGFLSAAALAETVDAPELFLRKILQRLNGAGILESRQGPFGGYRLTGDPEQVSLLAVVEAVQGPVVMNECFADPTVCRNAGRCRLRAKLARMQENMDRQLADVSVASLAGPGCATEGDVRR